MTDARDQKVEVTRSSGNVFADIGMPDPDGCLAEMMMREPRHRKMWLRAYLFLRDGRRCKVCDRLTTLAEPAHGKPMDLEATIGHIVPRAFGSRATTRNTRLECHRCNSLAGAVMGRDLRAQER